PDAAARRRAHRGAWRTAPLYELALCDPDRFRRVPGHVARVLADDRRGRGRVPLASRRQPTSLDPGALDRDSAPPRRRYHDGARYLVGVGKPADLVGAVRRGIDMFDCVLPTRSGRTAQAFTRDGALNLRNARHAEDPMPLDPECRCPACAGFSRAYLHHLTKAGEILASMLLTAHNLTYYADLMAALRTAIAEGRLCDFAFGGAAP